MKFRKEDLDLGFTLVLTRGTKMIIKLSKIVSALILLTVLAIVSSVQELDVFAAGTSISGKSCNQKGAERIFQGKKYTCVLSKKKLVWNQGVAVKPKPISTPTPTPSASALETPNEMLAREILKFYEESNSKNSYKFEIRTCPNLNMKKSDEALAAYERALKFWATFYTPTQPVKWVMFSQLDYECWLSHVKNLEGETGDTKVWNPVTNVMGHCQLSPGAFCGYGTGVKSNGTFIQYNAIGTFNTRLPEVTVVHHEAVHFYQMALQSEHIKTSKIGTLPPWFIEGQANLVGMTIANNGIASSHRSFEISRLKKSLPEAATYSAQDWAKELKNLDSKHAFVFQNELGYSLGWIALEKIYQLHGLQKMHTLLLEVNLGLTFDEALQKVLNTTKDATYLAVGEYLERELK